jgi:Spy/CpxP family protein refolding chaperone
MARSRWIALAVLSATFLAGAMAGAATLRLLAPDDRAERPRWERPNGPRNGPGGRPSIFDEMGLTAGQKAAMDSIMEKRRREMRASFDSARAEIDRLLTPEQRQKMQEFRERRGRGHDEKGGPPGPRSGPRDSAKRPATSYYEPRSV